MTAGEKPRATSASAVVASARRSSTAAGVVVTSRRRRAMRSLSASVPIGARTVSSSAAGRRSGSAEMGEAGTRPRHLRTGIEAAERQRVEVELALHLRVGGEQDLETPVEAEPVHHVGADPTTDVVTGLEHHGVQARGGGDRRGGEAGEARPHHGHIDGTRKLLHVVSLFRSAASGKPRLRPMGETVRYECRDRIAVISYNRPEARNAVQRRAARRRPQRRLGPLPLL